MNLLDELFRSEAMEQIFSDAEHLRSLLHFAAALARAEAEANIIPEAAARAIATKCQAELFDLKAIAQGAARSGNLAIPVIKQLTALVAKDDPQSAGFVHWGATSQDMIDTATVLQLRRAFELFDHDLLRLTETLSALIESHRHSLIVARTWMQQALPTTFGFIVAGWLDAILRDRRRFSEICPRVLTLQFGGAVGTLAALGTKGPAVAEALAKDLLLNLPAAPWHTHRDRFAEVATTFGICCGSLGKIARDVSLHSQTEIAELSEPSSDGRGGSSSMPHKRNPVTCAVVLAAAHRVPPLVSIMLSSMPQEEQRGLGGWQAEWETLPEIIRLTASALHHLTTTLGRLQVHTGRMQENLQSTNGLIFAEAISVALADRIGKSSAHGLVETACKKAVAEKRDLKDILLQEVALRRHLTTADIDRLFDPQNYLGSADIFVDRVLTGARELSTLR
jgi:3-carboxy-cis,cis-muconate cycloisomerase